MHIPRRPCVNQNQDNISSLPARLTFTYTVSDRSLCTCNGFGCVPTLDVWNFAY